jgi:hypothetical protein
MQSLVRNRKHLTPDEPQGDTHAMRRGGTRRGVTERVVLRRDGLSHEGWALNVSRGGVRLILEESVSLGDEFEVTIGDVASSPLVRHARVVWIQEEQDGLVVGLEFSLLSASERPALPEP